MTAIGAKACASEFATSSDFIIRLALWAGAIAALLSAALVVAIYGLRVALHAQRRRHQRLLDFWRPRMLASLATGEAAPALPRLRPAEVSDFLLLWNHFQGTVRGEAREPLRKLARVLDLSRIARRSLGRRGLRRRLLAAATLGQLGERAAWEPLQRIAFSAHPLLSLTAARALVQIDAAAAIPLLLPSLANRADWPQTRVATLLREAGSEVITPSLIAALDGATPEAAIRLVGVFDLARDDAVTPVLATLLARPDTDDRLATVCLRVLRDPCLLPQVRAMTGHARWHIRMEAAKTLGRLGTAEDLPRLERLLTDGQWWVRYRAAQALARLPLMTRVEFMHLRDRQSDRYARDILVHVLAEKGWA